MEDHSVADTDRQDLVREARNKELAQATVEGRVYVVSLDSTRVKSAEQARTSGKAILLWLWCAQHTTKVQILPDGMVAPERRTLEHLQEILESWLEHGELGIVARRQKARYQDRYRRTDRAEQDPPWMATMSLSSARTPTGGKLGKVVGAMALGFEMRDVPHSINHMMKGNIRRWYNRDKDEKKRKRSEQTPPRDKARGGRPNAAWAMGGGVAGAGAGGAAATKWRKAGGWTREQQKQWEKEETERKARDVRMHKRVERELEEIKRNPRAVSKKIERAIQRMGVSPGRDVVDKLAARVIAYRSQMGLKKGEELFQDKAMNEEVRAKVEEYKARK
jgi:hypothetical protein